MRSARPFSAAGSRRMRPTSTSSPPRSAPGVGKVLDPYRRRRGRVADAPRERESAPPSRSTPTRRVRPSTGTRTQVALTGSVGQLQDLARLLARASTSSSNSSPSKSQSIAEVVLGLRLVEQLLHAAARPRPRPTGRWRHADGARARRASCSGLSAQRQRDRRSSSGWRRCRRARAPASPFTSGTTSGMPSCRRNAAGLVDADRAAARRRAGRAPRLARCRPRRGRGRGRRRRAPPAWPPRRIRPSSSLPAERAEANSRTSSKPRSRSTRDQRSAPTAPVRADDADPSAQACARSASGASSSKARCSTATAVSTLVERRRGRRS